MPSWLILFIDILLLIISSFTSYVFFKQLGIKFYQEFPQFETIQRKNFEKRIAALQNRILSLLTLSASKKYNQFIKDYADFEKIIVTIAPNNPIKNDHR